MREDSIPASVLDEAVAPKAGRRVASEHHLTILVGYDGGSDWCGKVGPDVMTGIWVPDSVWDAVSLRDSVPMVRQWL